MNNNLKEDSSAKLNEDGAPITRFAQLFKSYGIALGIIVASVPIATRGLDLLPSYESNKDILTFFTSLVSLLGVALLFAGRRIIGNRVLPPTPPGKRALPRRDMKTKLIWQVLVPSVMILVSVITLIIYLAAVNNSIGKAAQEFAYDVNTGTSLHELLEEKDVAEASLFGITDNEARVIGEARNLESETGVERLRSTHFVSQTGVELVLDLTPSVEIPNQWAIQISYVFMFLSAAMAFVWFGIIEYVQQERAMPDRELLDNPYIEAEKKGFVIEQIKDIQTGDTARIYFEFEYKEEGNKATLIGRPDGPYCRKHNVLLRYGSYSGNWYCTRKVDSKKIETHPFELEYNKKKIDEKEMNKLSIEEADKHINDLSRVLEKLIY